MPKLKHKDKESDLSQIFSSIGDKFNFGKHDYFLSSYEDDVIIINTPNDDIEKKLIIDLSKLTVRRYNSQGKLIITPITKFVHLSKTLKAVINFSIKKHCDNQNFRNTLSEKCNFIVQFFNWMVEIRGKYRVSSLSEEDFEKFAEDFILNNGFFKMFKIEKDLIRLLTNLEKGNIKFSQVSEQQDGRNLRFRIKWDFIKDYVGVNINKRDVPIWFYDKIAKSYSEKQQIRRKLNNKNSMYTFETLKKRLAIINYFYYIPNEYDKVLNKPYRNIGKTVSILIKKRDKLEPKMILKEDVGRTENIRLEEAIPMLKVALLWVYDYSPGIIKIFEYRRTTIEKLAKSNLSEKEKIEADEEKQISKICKKNNLPFEIVVERVNKKRDYKKKVITFKNVVKNLMVSCAILICINHGRRISEVIGKKYGLYYNCIDDQTEEGLKFIDIYIEKTLKEYRNFYANKIVLDSIEVLKKLSIIFRPLFTDEKIYIREINKKSTKSKRCKKLFIYPNNFTKNGFEKEFINLCYWRDSKTFYSLAGVDRDLIVNHSHPFRRLFAILYFYRHDNPRLLALQHHLQHLDPSTTRIYITDPSNRKTSERIESLYRKRTQQFNDRQQTEIDNINSELFEKTILEILQKRRNGGYWPRLVAEVYKKLLEKGDVKIEKSDTVLNSKILSNELLNCGFMRKAFPHGGCNAGTSDLEISEAKCIDQKTLKIRDELASKKLCLHCRFRDSNDNNITIMENEKQEIENRIKDYQYPLKYRLNAKNEIKIIDKIIKIEKKIALENIKYLDTINSLVNAFQKKIENKITL